MVRWDGAAAAAGLVHRQPVLAAAGFLLGRVLPVQAGPGVVVGMVVPLARQAGQWHPFLHGGLLALLLGRGTHPALAVAAVVVVEC